MGERMCSPASARPEDSNPLAAGNAPGCLARAASLEKRLERLSEGTCGGGLWALQHAARVVTLGRGYFAELQSIKTKLGRNRHPGRILPMSIGVRAMLTMWTVLLETKEQISSRCGCWTGVP